MGTVVEVDSSANEDSTAISSLKREMTPALGGRVISTNSTA